MIHINDIFEDLKKHGITYTNDKVYLNISNAKDKMIYCSKCYNKNFVWIDEYDQIAEWLENNNGLGLFLHGQNGVGKTLMASKIIPLMILLEYNKVVKCYDMIDLNRNPDEVFSKKLISLDDLGTEDKKNDWGEIRNLFSELIDRAEKQQKLMIITTNLLTNRLDEKYGSRSMDRIIGITKRIAFNHESFRRCDNTQALKTTVPNELKKLTQ